VTPSAKEYISSPLGGRWCANEPLLLPARLPHSFVRSALRTSRARVSTLAQKKPDPSRKIKARKEKRKKNHR
jgi:hypothetical protein